jgi:hypothetical protein
LGLVPVELFACSIVAPERPHPLLLLGPGDMMWAISLPRWCLRGVRPEAPVVSGPDVPF